MSRSLTFKLRVNKEERLLLGAVAERLARTRGDTIRFLVREAARELGLLPMTTESKEHPSMTTNAISTTHSYPIYNAKGQFAGYISDDTLIRITQSSDMVRIPLGWAWDTEILEEAKNVGVYIVIVVDYEANVHYETTLEEFLKYGQEIYDGHKVQLCLPLDYWMITEDWE